MLKALLDTSTYVDIRRASKNSRPPWAKNTLRNLVAYRAIHPKLTLSVFTAYELLDGIYRDNIPGADQDFLTQILPAFEIIYPDEATIALGAKIDAALSKGQTIGMGDTLIAATPIIYGFTLVNANTRHFPRIQAAGFPLRLDNWREASS